MVVMAVGIVVAICRSSGGLDVGGGGCCSGESASLLSSSTKSLIFLYWICPPAVRKFDFDSETLWTLENLYFLLLEVLKLNLEVSSQKNENFL